MRFSVADVHAYVSLFCKVNVPSMFLCNFVFSESNRVFGATGRSIVLK